MTCRFFAPYCRQLKNITENVYGRGVCVMFNLNAIINRVEYKSKYCTRTLMADISVVSETRYISPLRMFQYAAARLAKMLSCFYTIIHSKNITLHSLAYIHNGSPIRIMVYSQNSAFYNIIILYSEFHIFDDGGERNFDRYRLSIF